MKTAHAMSLSAARRRSAGFSLVELMVGVGVGLLSTIVIATVLANSEQQKRANSSGTDAQIAGTLALHELERYVTEAGYGLSSDVNGVGCALTANYGGVAVAGAPADLAPVVITPGADGKPSTIRVTRSNTAQFALPAQVQAPYFDPGSGGSVATTVVVQSTLGMSAGDLLAVVSPPLTPLTSATGLGRCAVFQATALNADNRGIQRTIDAGWNGLGDVGALGGSHYVVNLGGLEAQTFTVGPAKDAGGKDTAQHQLSVSRFSLRDRTSSSQVLQMGIVDLKAFYGKDNDNDGAVDAYDTTTPTTIDGWLTVKSVRVALLARSASFEKTDVTPAAPLWDVGKNIPVAGSVDCGSSKCIAMNPAVSTDWKHYHYKLYEVVIPLRNQLWRSDKT